MDLAEPILKAVRKAGYETPSPIQECAIPPLLEGKDLLGRSTDRNGKDCSFFLCLFFPEWTNQSKVPKFSFWLLPVNWPYRLRKPWRDLRKTCLSYELSPCTEEPATVNKSRNLSVEPKLLSAPLGVMDHIEKGYLKLDHLQALVLDEADEMLSMGFIDDIKWILEHTPSERQTALFSATMPKPIQRLAENYMQDPVKITIKVKAENSPNIRQRFIKVRQYEKREMMLRLLEIEKFDALLIFARTKNATMEIAEALQERDILRNPSMVTCHKVCGRRLLID